jgi:hypothetical protein
MHLLETRRCIVNIDVVINRFNYMHVEDIIKTFSALGVFEYDLLYLIPFGNAFKNKDELFLEPDEAQPFLDRVFNYADLPDYYIWTNRFPPARLEGHEGLIQDPHKLYDEILGRPDLFEGYYKKNEIHCYPEKCGYCFIQGFCNKFLYYMNVLEKKEKIEILTGSARGGNMQSFIQRGIEIELLKIPPHEDCASSIAAIPALSDGIRAIECSETIPVDMELFAGNPIIPVRYRVESIPLDFFNGPLWNGCAPVTFVLNKKNCEIIMNNADVISNGRNDVLFAIPSFEYITDARVEYENLFPVLRTFDSISVHNCAPCIHKKGMSQKKHMIHIDNIKNDFRLDLEGLIKEYIIHDYYAKSTRCSICIKNRTCSGMHINFIRVFGFKVLSPIGDTQAHG